MRLKPKDVRALRDLRARVEQLWPQFQPDPAVTERANRIMERAPTERSRTPGMVSLTFKGADRQALLAAGPAQEEIAELSQQLRVVFTLRETVPGEPLFRHMSVSRALGAKNVPDAVLSQVAAVLGFPEGLEQSKRGRAVHIADRWTPPEEPAH